MVRIKIGLFDIKFVPKTSWHRSIACLSNGRIWFGHKEIKLNRYIRLVFSRIWSRIRRRELLRANYSCEICGAGDSLHIHEVWEYNLRKKEQVLRGYKVLCGGCHRVHHSSNLVAKGEIDDIVKYIIDVNKKRGIRVGKVFVEERLSKAYDLWEVYSDYFWVIDVSREYLLWPFIDVAHSLLNYWIIEYRKNSLDQWLTLPTKGLPTRIYYWYLRSFGFSKYRLDLSYEFDSLTCRKYPLIEERDLP